MKAEEERLYQRRKAAEKKAESLRGYLEATCNGERFKGIRAEVSFRKTTSVVMDENWQDVLPTEYIRVKTIFEPNKVELKAALASGAIPGAHLETGLSTIIK